MSAQNPSFHERQMEILRAIVDEYVQTEEPVGSKALAERYHFDVSPATIRNDMAALEEAGLITQPHTSAGRIPTNKGYRQFVDRLARVKPLSAHEKRAIERFMEGANDLDEVVSRTVRLLAQLTKQVAVVQYPSLSRSKVRHLEILPLLPTRIMLVLITNIGRVEQRVVELAQPITDDSIAIIHQILAGAISGHALTEVKVKLEGLSSQIASKDRGAFSLITSTLVEMAIEHPEEKVVLAGTANLARTEAADVIHPILEALEEQVVLLRLLSDANNPSTSSSIDPVSSVQVKIGEEQREESLRSTSSVTVGYGMGDSLAGNTIGALGVLGPTRMDYASQIARVHAVARYLSRFMESDG